MRKAQGCPDLGHPPRGPELSTYGTPDGVSGELPPGGSGNSLIAMGLRYHQAYQSWDLKPNQKLVALPPPLSEGALLLHRGKGRTAAPNELS